MKNFRLFIIGLILICIGYKIGMNVNGTFGAIVMGLGLGSWLGAIVGAIIYFFTEGMYK